MQPKDSKKTKTTNLQVNSGAKNKRNEINTLINKLINRNKTSRATNDNNKLYQKLKETKYNKTARDTGKKRKKNESNYPTRSVNYEKSSTNIEHTKKQKTPNQRNIIDKKPQINKAIAKKNPHSNAKEYRKSPFLRSKPIYFNNTKKKAVNKTRNINEENQNNNGADGLLKLLSSISPIDKSINAKIINKNMIKIIELENKVKDIILKVQDEIEIIKNKNQKNINDNSNENNEISLEQNLEIINKESEMRKNVYIVIFNFITELLEQINQLSYNIAQKELKQLNNISNDENYLLFNNNNNVSDPSNNSLFASEIQEEFCDRLINITKSFLNSDFDISEINFKNNPEIKDSFGKTYDDNLFNDDEDLNDYNILLKDKNKNPVNIHPNEILDKIKNEKNDNQNRKVIHHYSNSLKVNSNLEKLEEKINNDEDNININQTGYIRNIIQKNNCFIF